MSSKLIPSLNSWVVSGTSVEVIVLSLPGQVIRSIAANLVRPQSNMFRNIFYSERKMGAAEFHDGIVFCSHKKYWLVP